MASFVHSRAMGRNLVQGTLLESVTSTDNGTWLPAGGFHPMTVHVTGITSATVELCGSCTPTKPADSNHGFPLRSITTDGGSLVDIPVQWIKARIPTYVSGTISVYITGSEGTY